MFGYIAANAQALTPDEAARYRGCYCGLCRELRQTYSQLARFCLTYDMTFLILLLSSLYEPQEQSGQERCLAHPGKVHAWWSDEWTCYAAALNTALAYYKCLDDWNDDRNAARFAESRLLLPGLRKAAAACPRACGAIETSLKALAAAERDADGNPDAGANAFGGMMGELFAPKDDRWAPTLKKFGFSLGKYVYFLDAVCDLRQDARKRRYNPLAGRGKSGPDFKELLTLLIGDAAAEFEKLPLVQDEGLLRNILYSGVWTPYWRAFPSKEADK
jgi:hypothetical protein